MASDGGDTQDLAEGAHAPRECMACRGTGRVISNLGGSPSTVECPWCGGGGERLAEIDAQAHWGPIAQHAAQDVSPDAPDLEADTQPADGQSADG